MDKQQKQVEEMAKEKIVNNGKDEINIVYEYKKQPNIKVIATMKMYQVF